MIKIKTLISIFGIVLFPLLAIAQSGGTFVMQKSAIAGGGDRSTGGSFVVDGTIGQTVAGTQSAGGTFSVQSGFWASGTAASAPQTHTVCDFDGDGKSDVSVYRESEGNWYILNSATNTVIGVHFGNVGDRIVPGDYDGDGKADFAVWRPANGTWYLLLSTGAFTGIQFGSPTDIPAQGDF